jgi:hypothetical protein
MTEKSCTLSAVCKCVLPIVTATCPDFPTTEVPQKLLKLCQVFVLNKEIHSWEPKSFDGMKETQQTKRISPVLEKTFIYYF